MRVYYTLYVRPFVCPPARPAGEGKLKHRKGTSRGKFGVLAGGIHTHTHTKTNTTTETEAETCSYMLLRLYYGKVQGEPKVVSEVVGGWFPGGFRWFPTVS